MVRWQECATFNPNRWGVFLQDLPSFLGLRVKLMEPQQRLHLQHPPRRHHRQHHRRRQQPLQQPAQKPTNLPIPPRTWLALIPNLCPTYQRQAQWRKENGSWRWATVSWWECSLSKMLWCDLSFAGVTVTKVTRSGYLKIYVFTTTNY